MKNIIYIEFTVEEKTKTVYKIVNKNYNFPVKREDDSDIIIELDNIHFEKFIDKINIIKIVRWKENKFALNDINWNIKIASYQEVVIEEGKNEGFNHFNNVLNLIKSMC
ncbi:MAG: hypothetical protein PHU94_00820 [Bacilli bacterium]|nr:hypothetical protein [Bacilli bacterium]MDD4733332.1 hypothetical protein [Bacilli bacterium]